MGIEPEFGKGDTVRVRRGLAAGEIYGRESVNSKMATFGGELMTISYTGPGYYHLKEDGGNFYWTDEMLEPVETCKHTNTPHEVCEYPSTVQYSHTPPRMISHEWGLLSDGAVTESKLTNDSKGGIMATIKSIPKRLKKVLDKDYKAMYQLDWLNGDLERTPEGTDELNDFLMDKYKEELGALARERVKEIEEEQE